VTQIRRATRADAEGIARVHVASWQAAYAGLLPDDLLDALQWTDRVDVWRERLTDAESAGGTWVVLEEQTVVGFASAGPARDDDRQRPTCWELYGIYLADGVWGRGVGELLASHVLAAMPDSVTDVSLWVLDGNVRARRFYERLGFVPDGVTKSDVIGGRDVLEVRYLR
jgi:ribosomal protein S18 acetylase RimI-like enzyme